MDMNNLGSRIRSLRKELGLSLEAVGTMVDVSHPTVGNWEKNRTEPSLTDGYNLACALNTSIDFLVKGKDRNKSSIDKDLLILAISDVEQAAQTLGHDFTPKEKAVFIMQRYELGPEPPFSEVLAIFDKG